MYILEIKLHTLCFDGAPSPDIVRCYECIDLTRERFLSALPARRLLLLDAAKLAQPVRSPHQTSPKIAGAGSVTAALHYFSSHWPPGHFLFFKFETRFLCAPVLCLPHRLF